MMVGCLSIHMGSLLAIIIFCWIVAKDLPAAKDFLAGFTEHTCTKLAVSRIIIAISNWNFENGRKVGLGMIVLNRSKFRVGGFLGQDIQGQQTRPCIVHYSTQ